ncbi:MAG TPA: hypothetical protein VGD66_14255 [Allosphingosinicella sp.]|jgi:hypothetical protein
MKHARLRSIAHNIADSLASGSGMLIGVYELDVFGEARRCPGGAITVDFLRGAVTEGQPSKFLCKAVARYKAALNGLCVKEGGSLTSFRELTVRYWSDHFSRRFAVTVVDAAGARSTTEYAGIPGRRVRIMDGLGRLRPKPSVR